MVDQPVGGAGAPPRPSGPRWDFPRNDPGADRASKSPRRRVEADDGAIAPRGWRGQRGKLREAKPHGPRDLSRPSDAARIHEDDGIAGRQKVRTSRLRCRLQRLRWHRATVAGRMLDDFYGPAE